MVKRVGDAHACSFPKVACKAVATDRGVTPFGSLGSLAVTEKDTVVVFSSAKKYA